MRREAKRAIGTMAVRSTWGATFAAWALVQAVLGSAGAARAVDRIDSCGLAMDVVGSLDVGGRHASIWLSRPTSFVSHPADPRPSCGCQGDGNPAWFRFDAAYDGIGSASVPLTGVDVALSVFEGSCGTLTEVACSADALAFVTFPVRAGATYFVQVSDAQCGAGGGEFELAIDVCGDGMVTLREQCDDGNVVDGDGCSSRCVSEEWGGFDQQFPSPRGCRGGWGSFSITNAEPAGQEFVPLRSPITSVQVLLHDNTIFTQSQIPLADSDTLTLRLREDSVTGAVLATATGLVERQPFGYERTPHMFWHTFEIAPPVEVRPGRTYVLELDATNDFIGWVKASVECDYAAGSPISKGVPKHSITGQDRYFRTASTGSCAIAFSDSKRISVESLALLLVPFGLMWWRSRAGDDS